MFNQKKSDEIKSIKSSSDEDDFKSIELLLDDDEIKSIKSSSNEKGKIISTSLSDNVEPGIELIDEEEKILSSSNETKSIDQKEEKKAKHVIEKKGLLGFLARNKPRSIMDCAICCLCFPYVYLMDANDLKSGQYQDKNNNIKMEWRLRGGA